MDLLKQCGKRLRQERERLGYNQDDFAAYGGVKRVAQYFYEIGERAPNLEYLLKIQEIGVNLEYVLNGNRTDSNSCLQGLTESDFIRMFLAAKATLKMETAVPNSEVTRLLSALFRANHHNKRSLNNSLDNVVPAPA